MWGQGQEGSIAAVQREAESTAQDSTSATKLAKHYSPPPPGEKAHFSIVHNNLCLPAFVPRLPHWVVADLVQTGKDLLLQRDKHTNTLFQLPHPTPQWMWSTS